MFRILLIVILMSLPAQARERYDEHLLPMDSIYTDPGFFAGSNWFDQYEAYRKLVALSLSDAFENTVVARVIVRPSFEPEYAIGLSLVDGQYGLLHLEPEAQYYKYTILDEYRSSQPDQRFDPDGKDHTGIIQSLESELPTNPADVVIDLCDRSIPDGFGAKVYQLWSEMLFRTRYPDFRGSPEDARIAMINIGLDGTTYDFSMYYRYYPIAGTIWTPRPESNTGQFVAIAELMKDACHAEDNDAILSDIERRTDDLLETLSKTVY
ncbi:MAG: hypothetical protein AAGC77_10675 [Pseudomonadota bacterium]